MSQPECDVPPGRADLVLFHDDFVEFRDHCAFLCEAMASMVAEEDRFDAATAMGIKRFCYWLQERAEKLDRDLKLAIRHTNSARLN